LANTLAYYNTATITAVKSFIVQAPGQELFSYNYNSPSQQRPLKSMAIQKHAVPLVLNQIKRLTNLKGIELIELTVLYLL
jgi:hypothetical protein